MTCQGKEVTQLALFKVTSGDALIGVIDGSIESWLATGKFYDGALHPYDLFMAPVKREGWIGISPGEYSDGSRDTSSLYKTREEVEGHFYPSPTFQIVKVEWEE